MPAIFGWLVPAAIVAVAIVLVLGLISLFKGDNPSRSNRLMRLRVLAQFVAIIVLMAALYFGSR
jgi:hypothetical protein